MYCMQGKRFFLLDLCRQLWLDEFAPELERRVPVLFPFWKGWMLLVRQIVFEYPSASPSAPLRAGGKSRDAFDKFSTSAYGSDALQAPQFRQRPLRLRSGPLTRGACLRLSRTPAKRLNFAKRG